MSTLYIDSNEPNPIQAIVKATIQDRQNNVAVQTKGLKTGDFVYKDTVIERKEASDLASSIKDGRLKEQTLRMSQDFEHQYIIVEGNPYDLKYSSLHNNSFIGTLVSRANAGIGIIYTPDQDGTAYAINKIISKHEEGEEKVEELERTKAETEDPTVAMLTCIKGISKDKAEKIVSEYGSDIHRISYLEPDKLQQFKGVGPKLSNRIIDTLNGHTEDQWIPKTEA